MSGQSSILRSCVAYLAIGTIILVPILVLTGWATGNTVLTSVFPQFTPMNPVTASCFIVVGFALLLDKLASQRAVTRVVLTLSGLLTFMVGLAMLVWYVFGIDVRIDRILFENRLGINRMALGTSVNFFLLGLYMFVRRTWSTLSRFLLLIVGAIAVYALLAYLYNFIGVYGQTIFNPIAIHTAALFFIVSMYLLVKDIHANSFLRTSGGITFIVMLLMSTGVVLSSYIYTTMQAQMASTILDTAHAVQQQVSIANIEMLTGTEADVDSPEYTSIKALLSTIPRSSTEVRFVYLLGKRPSGDIFFYVDSESPSSPDYSPPGQEYPEASEELQGVWNTPNSIIEGPTRDRWGTWISGLVPMQRPDGSIVAVLGIDIDAHTYMRSLVLYTVLPIVVAAVVSVVVIVLYRKRRLMAENTPAQTF
jgi:hypothetical protein